MTDLSITGVFRCLPGCEVKYFTPSLDDALAYGAMAQNRFEDGPYGVVSTSIDDTYVQTSSYVVVDGSITAVVLPASLMNRLAAFTLEVTC